MTRIDTPPNSSRFGIGELVAGRLRILRELGRGGMGTVYEVEHELTRHRRALKLLHAHMSALPSVVERFLREASAAGRIGNPHIVETFDAGRLDSGEPYIVMELLQGVCLSEYLAQHGPLEPQLASQLLGQACEAVDAAHEAGVVHRDLKPENLHLSFTQGFPFVKILDFGISKFDADLTGIQGFTLEGTPIGTPYYMAPEQFQGGTVDRRSDVYALGVVLYECLTGRKPFESDTLTHLIALVLQGNYAVPSELRPELPKTLDAVVAKAMAIEREHRYATARELHQALLAALDETAHQAPSLAAPKAPSLATGRTQHSGSRAIAALTPDVFSKPPRDLAKPVTGKARLSWLGGSIAALLLITSLFALSRRTLSVEPQPSSLASPGLTTVERYATPAADASSSAASVSPVASAPSSAASVSPVASAPSSSAASVSPAANAPPAKHAESPDGLRRTSLASPVPASSNVSKSSNQAAAPSPTAPSPSTVKKRSSAYGLNETNPFE